jgi:hypothetical protein
VHRNESLIGRALALALLLSLSAVAFAGTAVFFRQQEGAPAALIETTHGANDLLISARLKNCSTRQIISYRIGWAYVGPGNQTDVRRGVWMNVPAGIAPAAVSEVPDQNVAPKPTAELTVFFVAEIVFADKTHWRANVKDVVKDAIRAQHSPGRVPHTSAFLRGPGYAMAVLSAVSAGG